MSEQPRQIYVRAGRRRRRARRIMKLLVVTALLILAWLALRGGDDPDKTGSVRIVVGERTVAKAKVERLVRASPPRLHRWLNRVPDTRREQRGRATISLATDENALHSAVKRALRDGGGRVVVPERPTAAIVDLPVVKQAFRNNCETAALSMLLAGRGVRVSQLRLQRELPRSGPLDPRPDPGGGLPTWGDPDRGFVGRVEGGGASGGYGVYERPIRDLSRRHGVALKDFGRVPIARIYQRLLSGRPMIVWIGLSDGPYKTWRTTDGRRLNGNLGEHTVVLTGVSGSQLELNDPLTGTRATWGRDYFRGLWGRLGRRALSL